MPPLSLRILYTTSPPRVLLYRPLGRLVDTVETTYCSTAGEVKSWEVTQRDPASSDCRNPAMFDLQCRCIYARRTSNATYDVWESMHGLKNDVWESMHGLICPVAAVLEIRVMHGVWFVDSVPPIMFRRVRWSTLTAKKCS